MGTILEMKLRTSQLRGCDGDIYGPEGSSMERPEGQLCKQQLASRTAQSLGKILAASEVIGKAPPLPALQFVDCQ